jgi:hypothetical protein
MPRTRFAISSFKSLPDIAEIIALGQVRRQPTAALETQIEVLLASNLDDPEFDSKRDVQPQWVGCGQLDLLTVGSRWKEGRRAGETQAKRFSARYSFSDDELLGPGADVPVKWSRRLPTAVMKRAPCFLLERERDPEDDDSGDPIWVLLPQMELIRALFGVSSRLLIQLMDGLRDSTVADRGILDKKNSSLRSDGTVHLTCCRKPTDEEALILAVMIADPAMMRLHNAVFQKLVTQKDYRDNKPVWPEIFWPFLQPIGLTLEGRWFQGAKGRPRFLATKITEIGLEIGFSRIEVHYPGAGEEQAVDRLPPPSGRMRSSNARLVVLTAGRSPSSSRRAVEIASAPVAIPESDGVAIDFVAKVGPPRPRTSTLGEDPREEVEFSTASRQSGADTGIAPALIRRMVGGDASAATSAREEALRVTWLALRTAGAESGWPLTPYPVAGVGNLSLRDGGFDFRREGVLAGLNVGGRHVIFVDERVAPQDFRCLGLLVWTMKREAKWRDIQTIRAVHDGLRGHWGCKAAAVEGFFIFPVVRRGRVMADNGDYSELLRTKITEAIAKTG